MKALEIILVLLGIGIAIKWYFDPAGNYEPVIVLLSLVGVLVVEISRRKKTQEQEASEPRIEPENTAKSLEFLKSKLFSIFQKNQVNDISCYRAEDSTSFFAFRFAQAFAGVRSIKWFEGKDAVKRLNILLREPLTFEKPDGYVTPIWWWRDGNLQISRFRRLSKNSVLLNSKELNIKKIAAVYSSSYKRLFVYVESEPSKPTGVYEWSEKKRQEFIDESGYVWEEYGLYKGKHAITRAEYDDGAAMIRGKHTILTGRLEIRERYLSPYNFVIAPVWSPINNNNFDSELRDTLNNILTGAENIEGLAEKVRCLPNFGRDI